jgi:hypothetical protein
MAKQSIEEILEKKVNWLKERMAEKANELRDIQIELKRHERALSSFKGKFAEKRGRSKKEKIS